MIVRHVHQSDLPLTVCPKRSGPALNAIVWLDLHLHACALVKQGLTMFCTIRQRFSHFMPSCWLKLWKQTPQMISQLDWLHLLKDCSYRFDKTNCVWAVCFFFFTLNLLYQTNACAPVWSFKSWQPWSSLIGLQALGIWRIWPSRCCELLSVIICILRCANKHNQLPVSLTRRVRSDIEWTVLNQLLCYI